MKKCVKLLVVLAALLALFAALSISASAEEQYTEGYYTYTVSNGVATGSYKVTVKRTN